MRIHGILLTRDDDDIIGECITHALTWCDALYVFDTGSSDATRDIVAAAASRDNRVIRVNEDYKPVLMESGLRGYVFEKCRSHAEPGDWFAQVDVDEFYHEDPRQFIQRRLHRRETAVWNLTYEFRLTEAEVRGWQLGHETLADRRRPIADRRRWYTVLDHSEPRMFRYRPAMQWPPSVCYPYNTGFVARERIPVRHYPHRDPLQLEKRWLLRKLLAPVSDPNWKHWQLDDWAKLVSKSDEASLHYWERGTPLPLVEDYSHLPHWPKRMAQWVAHTFLLAYLDRIRPKIGLHYQPSSVPIHINQEIVEKLSLLDQRGVQHP